MLDRQSFHPAQFKAESPGSGSQGHVLDGAGVVRRHDRRGGQHRLAVHGTETKDERNQGEHLNLKFWIAAVQHADFKWRHRAVATNATGSIAIAGNECAAALFRSQQDA